MSASDHAARGVLGPIAAGTVAAVLALSSPVLAADRIVAAAVGNGAVELFWLPEGSLWPPGGWRLDRISRAGETVVAEPGPARDTGAMARLAPEASAGIAGFARSLAAGQLQPEELDAADVVFSIAATINPDYGRALGLRFTDRAVPPGPVTYRLVALDARGAAIREAESDPVDSGEPAPLPHAPEGVRADVGDDAVTVSWDAPPNIDPAPIAGYRVVRVVERAATDLTPDLQLRTAGREAAREVYVDAGAPLDRPFSYRLTSVDLFGRESTPKTLAVGYGALALAAVPSGLTVEAIPGGAALAWSPASRRGVAGYVVERSLFSAGPYEVATPRGIPAAETRFVDEGLAAGTAYFFRVRVVDGAGALGRPSFAVKVVPLAAAAPAAPENLTAAAGPTRVTLAWDEPADRVAGYFVYRRAAGDRAWSRLNGTITPEPLFHDRFARGSYSGARLEYRIAAVGFDSRESEPSSPVAVAFGDTAVPPAPAITAASGEDGVARLAFAPGLPADDAAGFLLLRADDAAAPGLVVGGALPATARDVVDEAVVAGTSYWYELVTIDAAGNRSDPSGRVAVTVAAPALPAAPGLRAAYRAEPFPHVALTVPELPTGVQALVESRAEGSRKWVTVAGPLAAGGTVNLFRLPARVTEVAYRLVYQAANGARGAPSPETVVRLQ